MTKTTIIQHHTLTDSGDREQECVQLWRFYVSNSHCQDNPALATEIGGKVIILFDLESFYILHILESLTGSMSSSGPEIII